MYNWSTDTEALKQFPDQYTIWRLEQLINFGLGEEKLDARELEKYWTKILIDPARRRFLSLLLHGE